MKSAFIATLISICFAIPTLAETSTANGKCSLTSSDGGKYEGNCKDGKRDGYGVYSAANGAKYEGQFKDNRYDGKGKLALPDGATYVGDFSHGKLDGRGTYTFANGNKYVGEFKDGKKNGAGVFHFADGKKKTCNWVDDKCSSEQADKHQVAQNNTSNDKAIAPTTKGSNTTTNQNTAITNIAISVGAKKLVECLFEAGYMDLNLKGDTKQTQQLKTLSNVTFRTYTELVKSYPNQNEIDAISKIASKNNTSIDQKTQIVLDCGDDQRVKPLWRAIGRNQTYP